MYKSKHNFNSQSAGVCKEKSGIQVIGDKTKTNINNLTAPQRIYAKELWYILGLFEADGSISCYKEKNNIRLDLVIALEARDAKLIYWIKRHMKHGQVKLVKYSNNKNRYLARYIVRSKEKINNIWFNLFNNFPLLTQNKNKYYNWIQECLKYNQVISKDYFFNKKDCYNINYNVENNPYIKDWIIGFIEGDGNFYFVKTPQNCNLLRAEFNIGQKLDKTLLIEIGKIIGLSGKNNVVLKKKTGQYILTAVSLKDIQAVIDFMCNKNRVRLKGLKKVKFLLWLKELRTNVRYSGLKIPSIY